MTNHCGTCTACCRIFDIPELEKPAGKWCEHCEIGRGCSIYDSRPQMCRDYECLWLQAQQKGNFPLMGPEARPDKCKVVFTPTTNETIIAAITMPHAPDAWMRGAAKNVVEQLVRGGMAVVAGTPTSTRRTMIDKDGTHEVRLTEPDPVTGMQYNIQDEEQP